MTEKKFIDFLNNNKINYTEEMLEQLKIYKSLLQESNEKFNLTAIVEDKEIYLKHFCDSLLLLNYIKFNDYKSLVDIGTGAGLPGIVLKIFVPNIHVFLIESNGKKCSFLQIVKEKLQLNNLDIINSRAEEYAIKNIDKYDIAVSRAVAPLNILTELCLPLVKETGIFVAMKGKVEEEVLSAEKIIKKLNGEIIDIKNYKLPILEHDRSIVVIKKVGNNPKGYPRKYSEILKSN